MKTIRYPKTQEWPEICKRPALEAENLEGVVGEILERVHLEGDAALLEYGRRFDCPELEGLVLGSEEINAASLTVPAPLKAAIMRAKDNIERFHRSQWQAVERVETSLGVECWRRSIPIERVGLYIPGGTAPLFSTLLMLGVPARIAGCKDLVICTPPGKDGTVHPAILFSAELLGIQRVFLVGGAQAVGAMTFGTETVPKVDKLFGPGNQYVTQAKVMAQRYGVAMDLPAGPSELLVVADETAKVEFVVADLLSQAEHGTDSQVVLVTDDSGLLGELEAELEKQLSALPRREIAETALAASKAVLVNNLEEAIAFSNAYAPEHLILAVDDPESLSLKVSNAGSVFLGHFTPESAGDYASGTNHTLPTNGFARNYSGVSLDSFVKKITFQKITWDGIQDLGPAIERMAAAELLEGHKNAVTVRLNTPKP